MRRTWRISNGPNSAKSHSSGATSEGGSSSGPGAAPRCWARVLALGRQDNQPGPVQLEHQTAGHHIAELAVGLHPVPRLAEFGGKPPPAQSGMIGDQLADGFNSGATDIAPAITKLRLHDRQHRRSNLERKPIVEPFCRSTPHP